MLFGAGVGCPGEGVVGTPMTGDEITGGIVID
jgi:hypothetical protein